MHDYTTDTTSYDYAYHCCEYFGCIDPLATNYLDLETERDCSGITDGNDTSCCTYAPTDINLTLNILQEEFNSNTYPTKFVELNWNHPQTTYCDQDESSPWYYEICFGDQQCDFYDNTSAIYPFEWNDNISYSFKAYGGCVVGISGELIETKIEGEFTSPERPIPEIPNIPIVSEETSDNKSIKNLKDFWLIDPIDGTYDYINNLEEFTINAGLIINNNPVIGLINAPSKKRMFYSYGNNLAFEIIN